MPEYKLLYFNVKARAEPTRFLFAIAGVKYEDKRVNGEEFGKLKADLTLGQLPVLYVDGKEMPQSRAMARYVAREHGLYGANAWEQASVDVVCETVDEIWSGLGKVFSEKDDAKKDAFRKEYAEGDVAKTLGKLEKLHKQNNGGAGWLVGNKISLADAAFYSAFVDFLPAVCKCDLAIGDSLKGLISRFEAHDKAGEWIKNRPKTDM